MTRKGRSGRRHPEPDGPDQREAADPLPLIDQSGDASPADSMPTAPVLALGAVDDPTGLGDEVAIVPPEPDQLPVGEQARSSEFVADGPPTDPTGFRLDPLAGAEGAEPSSDSEASDHTTAVEDSPPPAPEPIPEPQPTWDGPVQIDADHVVDTDGEVLVIVRDHGPWRFWERLNGWDRRLLFSTGLVTLLGTFFYCVGLTSLSFAPSFRPKVEAAPETPTVTPSNTPIVIFFDPVATETIGPTPTEAPPPVLLPPTPTEPPRRTPTPIPPPTAEPVDTVSPVATATFFVPIPPLQTPVATSASPTAVNRTPSPAASPSTPSAGSPTRPAGTPSVVGTATGTRAPATTASPIATTPPTATRPPASPSAVSATPAPPTNTPSGILPATPTRPTVTATSRPP